MKKFLIRLGLFSLIPIAFLVLIFVIPINRKYAYNFVIRGGCEGRSSWIYQRMFESDSSIDVAFIGSSHTMSAINDQLTERYFNDSVHRNYKFANLGYCGFGRDFHYLITEDLLEHKKVKCIVLELTEAESQFGSGSFPNVASTMDLLDAPVGFNRSYFPDLYKGLLLRIQYFRELVTKENLQRDLPIPESRFGFNGTDRYADTEQLESAKQKHYGPQKPTIAFVENGLNSCAMVYVQRIATLAKKYNVRLCFVYLPEFGFPLHADQIEETYGAYGKIIIPGQQILDSPTNWCDKGHLNTQAANAYSKTLADELIGLIR
jgi:hypothetical protein